ncbi:MAG TPA: helix-turn-helix transcriptional regulator [Solirubrobacteraceae bacterium]|nr:helix-turn-helix transcriptional regulator [Solirubrobacteraceae bacterium]
MAAGELQGHVDGMLLAVLSDGPLHGYRVAEELRRRSGGEFDLAEGTIYPALHRMESAGLLSSRWEVVGGRRRRVYAISSSGRRAVIDRRSTWRAFRGAVDAVFGAEALEAG